MEEYTKPPLSYEEQVSILKRRGLTVESTDAAIQFLQKVSYYRLSAYSIPFQNPRDVFLPGSSFDKITELYRLDESLRIALLALLSPIEIFMRSRMVYELSHSCGAFALYDRAIFRSDFNYDEFIATLNEEVSRAKETFIDHYKNKYEGFPRMPIWMACEIISIGSLSKLYSGLVPDPQRRISKVFEIHHYILRNWFHVISYLRNIAAHHGRLWNREFSIRPIIPRDHRWVILNLDNTHLFSSVVMLEWICRKTNLPVASVSPVHLIMRDIAAIDTRFSGMMGIPEGRSIDMFWEQML